jgi:hypothetical protein
VLSGRPRLHAARMFAAIQGFRLHRALGCRGSVPRRPAAAPPVLLAGAAGARHHGLRSRNEGGEESVQLLDVHRPASLAVLEEFSDKCSVGSCRVNTGRKLFQP